MFKVKNPYELLMENAGVQLARLVAIMKPEPCDALIGVGPGNNDGEVWLLPGRLACLFAPLFPYLK